LVFIRGVLEVDDTDGDGEDDDDEAATLYTCPIGSTSETPTGSAVARERAM
jgi:hypothetical protein